MQQTSSLPEQTLGRDGPRVVRIALGCMGLSGTWNASELGPENTKRAITAFEAAVEAGITLYDHADIYGGGTCEEVFAGCLRAVPGVRDRIIIATKGGIRQGHYDLSPGYITSCVERSLRRMGIDYIDLYQLHRPDPLTHPAETARALNDLLRRGLIRYVGVSNYYPEQIRALQRYLEAPLRSNQIEISLVRLDPIYEGWDGGDGTLDQCMALGLTPMAWSPLGAGSLMGRTSWFEVDQPRVERVRTELAAQAERLGATPVQVALAWLLAHPAGIIPIVGSANPEHIREAVGSLRVELGREDWYKLWVAAWGRPVP
ncbi:MAG TPA: aldo/keto reductase [Chloroflexota bacterium]|nr:aldo/keto reductase [Chloroflexota bacterium]